MSLHPTDYGHSETDKELEALLRRLEISYREARISLFEKVEKYMDQFAQEDAFKRALYDSGELSHEDYMAWRARKFAGTKQWRDMLDQLSDDMTNQNRIAASMIDDSLPDVYALNHNYGTFEAEKGSGYDTTYTMYDKFTVKRLLTEHDDLLPRPKVDIPKDMLWNKQHIQSAVLQGILTGESMGDIAKRLMTVSDMTKRSAMRNARTAVTGAENAGRIDSYKRANKMGIKMRQQWMATLDGRTRDSHVVLDGETQEVGKKFSNGCRYPGDPSGPGEEVYNCRCTVVAIVAGADPYNPNLRESAYLKEQGLTYEEWKEKHGGHVERQQDNFDRSKISYSSDGKTLKNILDADKVEYKLVQKLPEMLTEEQIINKISGGDMTKGSCVSLACSYIGNKLGFDVTDFRGGKSGDVFAKNTQKLMRLNNINPEFLFGTDAKKIVSELLPKIEEGKEYALITGQHMSIVRLYKGKYQYLELQSTYKNGWSDFKKAVLYDKKGNSMFNPPIEETLRQRFGGDVFGATVYNYLVDIDQFNGSDEFRDLLGYINTAEDQQKKGSSGSIK